MKILIPFSLVMVLIVLTATSFSPFHREIEPKTKAELGALLFKDKRFSKNNTISCSSCHIPEFAFSDTVAISIGADGLPGKRNTPSIMNMAFRPYFFYDGRAASLEDQVVFPVEDHLEMNVSFDEACRKIALDSTYVLYFKNIFSAPPTPDNIKLAIAAFERTLETSDTPFDRWMAGDSLAMTPSQVRGRELFMDEEKTKCFACHFSPDFTGDEFHNIGLFDGKLLNDSGRFSITKNPADIGRFKTPGLRNIAITGPYMHNGMFRTLMEVLEYYNDPYAVVPEPAHMDTLLNKPLGLTREELTDIENFLHALTDDRFKKK